MIEQYKKESTWLIIIKVIAAIGAFCLIVTCGRGCDKIQKERNNQVNQRVFQRILGGSYILETDRGVNNFHKRDIGSYKYIDSIKIWREYEAYVAVDTLNLLN